MEEIVFDSDKKNITVTLRYETALYLYHAAVVMQKLVEYELEERAVIDSMTQEAFLKIQEASAKLDALVAFSMGVPIFSVHGDTAVELRCAVCNSPEINTLEGEEPYCALHEPKLQE